MGTGSRWLCLSVINEAEARDTLDALQNMFTLSRMSVRCCMARKNNAFCCEYRAPEQVMQLIEHLRERAYISLTQPNALCGLWKCVAVIPRYL